MNDNKMPSFIPLTGQFLVAVPGMEDARFDRKVVYIFRHTEEDGAQGLVINQPAERLFFQEILMQMHIPVPEIKLPPLLLGGPVQAARGFILHSPDYTGLMTQPISADVSLTTTQEILRDIAGKRGPKEFLLILGCATWRRGQLEDELMSNTWLTVPADNQILFHTPYADRWREALKSVGIDAYRLSGTAGKA